MQSTYGEKLTGPTAFSQAPSFVDEGKTQSDSYTQVKSIMHCKPRTKEQIPLDDTEKVPVEQTQDHCRPTTMLTDDLLWDYIGFHEYILSSEPSDTSCGQTTEQGIIRYRSDIKQPFGQLYAGTVQVTE